MTEQAVGPPRPRPRRGRLVSALLLFVLLVVAYHVNGTVIPEGDAVPTENLPMALLSTHRFTFGPERFPEMFKWKSHAPFPEKEDFFFVSFRDAFGDRLARDWRALGNLEFNGPRYYVLKSKIPGEYVSTFGPIPGLILFPFLAPFYAKDPDLPGKLVERATIGKLCSSILVAATAVMIFWIVERWLTRRRALLVATIYGVGTCAWAISSQAMWQQTVDQFFLAWGALFVLGRIDDRRSAALAGLMLGLATACRPTSGIVVACVTIYLWVHHRRSVAPLILGVAPPLLAIACYNRHFFGSPFTFGQQLVGHAVAAEKTGSANLWQTPIWLGAAGLLVSPSRGLLIFSPVLGAAFPGAVCAWRDTKYRALRPFIVATFAAMLLQCKWFDWWGGHAYGYRPWLDVLPYLVLLVAPTLESMTRTSFRRASFGAVFAWSVFVQALGAMSYDHSWNLRQIFVFRVPTSSEPQTRLDEGEAVRYAADHGGTYLGPSFCDVDLWFCRGRLWSLGDNMILYQITHYSETRGRRYDATFSEPSRW